MSETDIQLQRPKRADARRNYDKLVAAARATFAEAGTSAPLEDIAQRAGVGIGTLYRHFPTRQALLEAAPDSDVLISCRTAILSAGTALLERAQEAGVVRPDTDFLDVGRMVSGIAVVPTADPGQKERLLALALDGLRYRPA